MAIESISTSAQLSTTESVRNFQANSAESTPEKTETKSTDKESSIVSLSSQQESVTSQNNQASGLYNLSKSNFQSASVITA